MTTEATNADLAFFTPTVKPLLGRFDSSEHSNQIKSGSMKMQLGAREVAFIANREWFYVAAMGQDGWPYTQRLSRAFPLSQDLPRPQRRHLGILRGLE